MFCQKQATKKYCINSCVALVVERGWQKLLTLMIKHYIIMKILFDKTFARVT